MWLILLPQRAAPRGEQVPGDRAPRHEAFWQGTYVAVQLDRSTIDITSFCRFLLCFLQDVHLIMLRVCGALFNNVVGSISGFDNRWEDAEHGDGRVHLPRVLDTPTSVLPSKVVLHAYFKW